MKDLGLLGSIKESYALVFKNPKKMIVPFILPTLEIIIGITFFSASLLTFLGYIIPIEIDKLIIASKIIGIILFLKGLIKDLILIPSTSIVGEKYFLDNEIINYREAIPKIKNRTLRYIEFLFICIIFCSLCFGFNIILSAIIKRYTDFGNNFLWSIFQFVFNFVISYSVLFSYVSFALKENYNPVFHIQRSLSFIFRNFILFLVIYLIFCILFPFFLLVPIILYISTIGISPIFEIILWIFTIFLAVIYVPIIQTNLTYWYLKAEEKND